MGPWGFDVAGMDKSVKPGDDFFAFTSGTWEKTATIPADRARYGAFDRLRELSDLRVKHLVETITEGGAAGQINSDDPVARDRAKIAIWFQTYMDEAKVEVLDSAPLKPLLEEIAAIGTHSQLAGYLGGRSGLPGASLVGVSVGDDSKNPDFNTVYMGQGGLGLSNRDFYLLASFKPQKQGYEKYVATMLEMSGWAAKVGKPAAELAAAVVAFETKIAEAHWSRAESRNRDKTYNPYSLAELVALAPDYDWKAHLLAAGLVEGQAIRAGDKVVISQNTAIPKLAKVFAETDMATLQTWAAFHLVDESAGLLSKRFVDAAFDFRSKFLNGVPEQRSRVKRAVSSVEGALGEVLGREYVTEYFPPEHKQQMEELVDNLKLAMKARIDGLEWMSPETRAAAQTKLEKFNVKIGYPAKWRDYSGLEVVAGDLFGNAMRAAAFGRAYNLSKLGKPVDKAEWGMNPQTVNAYYSSTRNEIVFPAAILQPPFFDPKADAAINYGAIGGVIGHEITHGFDDQGRKSDGDGVLRDWWTADDAAKFEAQAAILGAQYEAFEFPEVPGVRINGRVSMGENIADLGGVLLALDGYKIALAGKPPAVIDGFTGPQRVFLGWAQVWRTMQRPDALRQQLVNGPHSPGRIRALAPVRNVDAWYEAFGIEPGDKLYVPAEKRVRIW
jgi:putative endopeptidase